MLKKHLFFSSAKKVNPMKPILRYQSQLLFRRSYKPKRTLRLRIRPAARITRVFRPVHRFGVKPVLMPE